MLSCSVFSGVCLCVLLLCVRGRPPLWRGTVTDFWCQEWDRSLAVCIGSSIGDTITTSGGLIMATAAINYDSWSLEDLRAEATKRNIYFSGWS